MSMIIPQLIISSIIKDGIADLKANPNILDDVFGNLTSPHAQQLYGSAEIQKIRDLITGVDPTEIAVVNSFYEARTKTPCYSLQLAHSAEDRNLARVGDFDESSLTNLTPGELTALVKETNIIPTSYNPLTGKVSLPDTVDLTNVHPRFIYEDGSGVEHTILAGISETLGNKFFFIAKQSTPDIVNPGLVKSFLTQKIIELRGSTDNVDILIGVHTKEALLTVYLHVLLQFILLSRKEDMIRRCFFVSSTSSSDFNRDEAYQGDSVFVRFLTVSGKIEHSWNNEMFNLTDVVELDGTGVE